MKKMTLVDLYDLCKSSLYEFGFEYTDFVKDNMNCEYSGYAVAKVDESGIGYACVNNDNTVVYSFDKLNKNIGIRPSIKYSYIKDFIQYSREIKPGILEVSLGKYPGKRYDEKVNRNDLIATGDVFTIVENDKLIELKEYEDIDGNLMVCRNGIYYCVEPLKWYVNINDDIMITKEVINGGMSLDRELTEIEKFQIEKEDKVFKKISTKQFIQSEIRECEDNLVYGFIYNILNNEILGNELVREINKRDQNLKLEEYKRIKEEEIKKIMEEKQRIQRSYLLLSDPDLFDYEDIFNNSEERKELVKKELINVGVINCNKEIVIYELLELYRTIDASRRKMLFPEERYENIKNKLETMDIEFLNVVLKEVIDVHNLSYYYSEFVMPWGLIKTY